MNSNIKLLLGLLGVTILMGGYMLMFAPITYEGIVEFATIEEYNTYRVVLGKSPVEQESRFPREVRVITSVSRGRAFPYGDRQEYHIFIGVLSLVVATIAFGALGWEVKQRLGRGREE